MRGLKRAAAAAAMAVVAGAAGYWILIHPDNAFTGLFRGKISRTGARVITGPYPVDSDYPRLKSYGVTAVVSLLDPALPYEKALLEREQAAAARFGMRVLSFPMTSVLGRRFGSHNESNAEAAARAIAEEPGKVYLHCYLGVHRAVAVAQRVQALGLSTDKYLLREGERTEAALRLDRAQADYDARRYQEVIASLGPAANLDAPAELLLAWSRYQTGDIAGAAAGFRKLRDQSPAFADANSGLGYCALRSNDLKSAEGAFRAAIAAEAGHAGAQEGLGLVYYRSGRLADAREHLAEAVRLDPANIEAKEALGRASR